MLSRLMRQAADAASDGVAGATAAVPARGRPGKDGAGGRGQLGGAAAAFCRAHSGLPGTVRPALSAGVALINPANINVSQRLVQRHSAHSRLPGALQPARTAGATGNTLESHRKQFVTLAIRMGRLCRPPARLCCVPSGHTQPCKAHSSRRTQQTPLPDGPRFRIP